MKKKYKCRKINDKIEKVNKCRKVNDKIKRRKKNAIICRPKRKSHALHHI